MNAVSGSGAVDSTRIDGALRKIIWVVVAGVVMTSLDMTIINVALQPLTLQFQTSFDTIQ